MGEDDAIRLEADDAKCRCERVTLAGDDPFAVDHQDHGPLVNSTLGHIDHPDRAPDSSAELCALAHVERDALHRHAHTVGVEGQTVVERPEYVTLLELLGVG